MKESMRIFEFQFNPKAKNDRFFRVFSFQAPEEMPDRGVMYIIGELAHALPTNSNLLDQLATLVSQEYYAPEKSSQNASHRLKNALKKANDFLAEETKKGNGDWLGNLHFLLLLFVPSPPPSRQGGQGYTLYFTKVGGMKLWLARAGSLVDVGKSIDQRKKDEGSTKVFGNVGSGKIAPQDRIVAISEELFEFFSKENFLQQITQLKEEKQFKSIFKSKEKAMSSLSGVLFFVLVEASLAKKEIHQSAFAQLKIPSFHALGEISRPMSSFAIPSFVKKKLPSLFALSLSEAKKRIGPLILLFFVLLLGFAIFGARQQQRGNNEEGTVRQEEMSEELRIAYKIVEIEEPEIVTEFNESLVSENPQRMIQQGSRFYFFGPSSSNITLFDSAANTFQVIGTGKNLKFGTMFRDSPLLFGEPNAMVSIDQQNTVMQNSVASFPAEFQPGGMEQFAGNLYFFDARTGNILKSVLSSGEQGALEPWLDPLSSKKPINVQAMGIDGNIWILNAENEIQRYFKGRYQETLHTEILPVLQKAILLKTGPQLPYLYILEPEEKRLVILDKTGKLLQQYRSPAFEQVRDFLVSPNDQAMYLFDTTKLYRISPVLPEST